MTADTPTTTAVARRPTAELAAEDRHPAEARPGGPAGTGQKPPAPPGRPGPGGGPPSGPATAWWRAERLLPRGLGLVAGLPLVALILILAALIWKAMPAIRYNGFGFFSRSTWNLGSAYSPIVTTHGIRHPLGATYGAWPLIVGTLQSSFIALLLAVPVGVGTALVVVEKLPPRLSNAVGFFLEVLAGIPSVVFGLWGALTFGPFLARHVAQPVADIMPNVPVLDFFRGEGPQNSAGYGNGLLVTGVVLAIMILPIIAATTRDLLRQVPRAAVEGAVALGMTDTEAVRAVTMPWVRAGVVGASILGLGRALGETVAVSMLAGGITGQTTTSLYGAMTTIASTIVNELDAAFSDVTGLALSTMAELGLVLLVITLLANVGARVLVRRVSTTALPVGRGV